MDTDSSIQFAKKYLEDLLSFFGINVEVTATLEEDVIELSVPSNDQNSILIGRAAETLRSIQYLVSTTLRNQNAAVTRVNVDIADYKKQRADKMAIQAREWIEEVRRTGEYSDIRTFSEGEGRDRQIIIAQASS